MKIYNRFIEYITKIYYKLMGYKVININNKVIISNVIENYDNSTVLCNHNLQSKIYEQIEDKEFLDYSQNHFKEVIL